MFLRNLAGLQRLNLNLHITYSWLAVADAVLFFASCYLAAWLYFLPDPVLFSDFSSEIPYWAGVFVCMTMLAMLSMGLYQPRMRDGVHGVLLRTLAAFIMMAIGMFIIILLFPADFPLKGVFVYAAGLAFVSSLITRNIFKNTVKLEKFNRRVLVLGAGRKASNIISKMRRKSDHYGFRICAYVRVPEEEVTVATGNVITLSQPLSEYVRQHEIHQVVVALDNQRDNMPGEELLRCRMLGVSVVNLLDFFEQEAGKVLVEEAPPEWFIFAQRFRPNFASGFCKRTFDIVAGVILLLGTWPFMLLTMLAIKIEDGFSAPVLFHQKRVGLYGQVFSVMKFRSMSINAEADGKARWATENDSRITGVGQVIRKLRIDELPQILNVLAGDMAFVGPRPERPEFVSELAQQIPYFEKRHCVKPGITGWAQLNYPYGSSVSDARHKLEFDLYYVKNQSLYLDCIVLLRTVEVVAFGKGAK
jgi:sugar transferase (PEP-CTERM system associated)